MKKINAEEMITAQDSRNNQSNVSKYSAEDYRHKMIFEWNNKYGGYDKTDAQLEAFLKSKGVKGRKCSISKRVFYGWDNNAFPFKGRCCNEANRLYVIPARMSGVSPELIQNYGGNQKFAAYMDKCLGRK